MTGSLLAGSASGAANRLRAAAVALGLAFGGTLAPAVAEAKAEVFFTEVVVPEGPNAAKQARLVRSLLGAATKRAHFGKVKKARIRAKVTEYEEAVEGDVVTIRCSMTGRLEGGPRAKSHLAYSGKASRRAELQKKVIGIVADGLVTRLAQMAREEDAAKERKRKREAEQAAAAAEKSDDEKNEGSGPTGR
jgi:hypothetical protein